MLVFQPKFDRVERARYLGLKSGILALIHGPTEVFRRSEEFPHAQMSHAASVTVSGLMRIQLEQARRRCNNIRKGTAEPLRLRQCLQGTQMVRISSQNLLTGIHRVSPIE